VGLAASILVVAFGWVYARRALEELRRQEGGGGAAAGEGEPAVGGAGQRGSLGQPMISLRTARVDDV
jgi:hypothetical protein